MPFILRVAIHFKGCQKNNPLKIGRDWRRRFLYTVNIWLEAFQEIGFTVTFYIWLTLFAIGHGVLRRSGMAAVYV